MTHFQLAHLVCEVPRVPAVRRYEWYEVDLDQGPPAGARLAGPHGVIGATRTHTLARLAEQVGGPTGPVTHVQFEATAAGDGRSVARAARDGCSIVRAAGLQPVPAVHLVSPPQTTDQLRRVADGLATPGPAIVKLVYPSRTVEQLSMGLRLLEEWPTGSPGLSLTPAGGRQARLAAALAGSRLVYAPLRSTGERMSAGWYRQLLETDGVDRGGDRWIDNGSLS